MADTVPDREAVVVGDRRLTYSQLEERGNRLANHLASQGIQAGDHLGLQLMNGSEYVEGMLAAFKIRAVPINVNYRYVEGELRHLYRDADLAGLIYHRSFGPRVEAALGDASPLKSLLVVQDNSTAPPAPRSAEYEAALHAARPDRLEVTRSDHDLYIVYTGGTTGLPKGVVWRHEDIFKAAMGGGDVTQSGNFIHRPEELAERITATPAPTALATPPLIHNSAHWLAFYELFSAGKLVLVPLGRFDPALIWELVAREQVFTLVLVGDAMARPLADELAAHPERYDTNSLWVIGSGGAILSESAKARLLELLPNRMIVDAFGSSETGVVGNRESPAGRTFMVNDLTAVLDDRGRPVRAGSGKVGRLARRGHIPLRYHNDPEKSARTFLDVEGVRWVLPGDMATVEDDGSITLLGRGSLSINTGGEKVFPEEVERSLKDHPAVADAVVVGLLDERWGERVVAVVQPVEGSGPTLGDLQGFCRGRIAGYKLPRALVLVEEILRSPAGKPDYGWARDRAMEALQGIPAREEVSG